MPREGVGVALGAQVGHVVTYRGSPEGSLIYTFFTKKYQKRSKMGYPLFLTHFRELSAYPDTPTPAWLLKWQNRATGALPNARFYHFWTFSRSGGGTG